MRIVILVVHRGDGGIRDGVVRGLGDDGEVYAGGLVQRQIPLRLHAVQRLAERGRGAVRYFFDPALYAEPFPDAGEQR